MFRKLLLYLGLGPDEAYEEFMNDDPVRRGGVLSSGDFLEERAATEGGSLQPRSVVSSESSVRPVMPETTGTVRTIQPAVASKPAKVAPKSFSDAQEMADRFLADQPVIINLQEVPAELSRRIIDFASGVCYGLGGSMEKVASQVYLMTPHDVEVSDDDRKRFEQNDLDI
ncbi:MAG: hypothetical protein CL420_04585 [Acidimicrobiaceae bacterium]|jgi:cell division inhibitor SepF|nr:hypothetical protein [Acidimicrobiaceae bacterium]